MRRPYRRRRVFPTILIILIILVGIILYDGSTRIVTTEYELYYKHLPEAFDGFRIVVLSDIHAAVFGDNNELLVEKVVAAKPDIIAITGDLIDGYKNLPSDIQLEVAKTLVTALVPVAPVYFITGNHDWDSGSIRPLLAMLEERGVHILRNKYTLLESGGETIVLAGVDDPNGPADMIKPYELIKKIKDAQGDDFIVLLKHRNEDLPLFNVLGVDLVICGHGHGGLIRLPLTDGLIGQQRDWFPEYTNGVYTICETNMLVSRGLGNHTGIPRVFNNPHIPVAILRTA